VGAGQTTLTHGRELGSLYGTTRAWFLFGCLAHIEGFLGVITQRPFELNVCAKSNMLISLACDIQECYLDTVQGL
jgi:hypothetical protein